MSRLSRIVIVLPLVTGACAMTSESPRRTTLSSQAFYDSNPVPGAEVRGAKGDASGPIVKTSPVEAPPPTTPLRDQPVTKIAPAVREVVAEPSTRPLNAPIVSAPGTLPSGTTAQYLTLGGVVTEVSGTPIYADQVLREITPILSSEAKQRDLASFKGLARSEIEKRVNLMIRDELLYAAATQYLSGDDKKLADNLTRAWRERQITEAGGSVEQARLRAKAEGLEFDEKVNDQHRTFLVQIFYQKRIYPQIEVTAEDMRRYYDQHLRDYTDFDQAQFRVIKITSEKSGGRDQALEKIRHLREQAVAGDDAAFISLAGSINDDAGLMKSAGKVGAEDGWLQRGSFAVKDLEEAVWKIQPGEITDVVDVNGAFYIARLENRKMGHVRSFDDSQVQAQVREELTRPQLASRRQAMEEKLLKEAVVNPYPPIMDPVLEMAMQKYAGWHTAQ